MQVYAIAKEKIKMIVTANFQWIKKKLLKKTINEFMKKFLMNYKCFYQYYI